MSLINDIKIRKILDSRGQETVEVDITTEHGFGTMSAPSGASTGIHEVDAFPKKGIEAGMSLFNQKIVPALLGMDARDQIGIDNIMKEIDGTPKLSNVGGNLIVATSVATAKAAADDIGIPFFMYLGGRFIRKFPYPLGNMVGGGKHAVGGTVFQEYLVCATSSSPKRSIFANARVHKAVKKALEAARPNIPLGKGDEGAWIAPMTDEEALKMVSGVCATVSKEVGFAVRPSLDLAASSFYNKGQYIYKNEKKSPKEQIKFIAELVRKYKLYFVEDPLEEDDFTGFAELTDLVGKECIICGDDLFVTNKERLLEGIKVGAGNAILIKVNQIGTLSDTIDTIKTAHEHGYKTIVSHRSGETTDESIAHIAVAFGCHAIKTGAVGGERIAKLNELVRIEEYLGE
jgi:enolase